MDIVLLAAGSSLRYEGANKLLIPFDGATLLDHSVQAALSAARLLGGKVVVVTGHQAAEVEGAARRCAKGDAKRDARAGAEGVCLVFVENKNHLRGQFSSTKAGLGAVDPLKPFFIAPSDLPFVLCGHYLALAALLEGHDAVRPFCRGVPGHPVLLAPSLRERLLAEPDSSSVRKVLQSCDVRILSSADPAWTSDIDSPSDYRRLRRWRACRPPLSDE